MPQIMPRKPRARRRSPPKLRVGSLRPPSNTPTRRLPSRPRAFTPRPAPRSIPFGCFRLSIFVLRRVRRFYVVWQ